MVDELLASLVDPGVVLAGGHERGEVPHPHGVAVIGAVEAAGADLGARRALQQLSGGGLHGVVQVTGQDHAMLVAVSVESLRQGDPDGGGLSGTPGEGVGAVAGAFVFRCVG